MNLFLAILVGKLILFLTKYFKIGGGSAAPGYYALKIDSKLVDKLSNQIQQNIIVTGTNGKTTTSRLLTHFANENNKYVIRNSTGSNLERGIASALISKSNFLGKMANFDIGIWEVDEAAFNKLALKINPQIIVFLNVLRDQLDRYGEIDSVVKNWKKTVSEVDKKTLLIINNDDENLTSLKTTYNGKTLTFGTDKQLIKGEKTLVKNLKHASDLMAKNVKTDGLLSISFQLTVNDDQLTVKLPIPGVYHVYDFLAAFFIGMNMNFDSRKMIDSLDRYSPAFGRVERLKIDEKDGWIFLIKNPFGASLVFQTLSENLNKNDLLFIALNDNFADGTDVSWIWDADFEKFENKKLELKVICSGTRAEDLALRLNYAGFNKENLIIENDLEKAFSLIKKQQFQRVFVMPTYTALLELQKILTKRKIKQHYWKES